MNRTWLDGFCFGIVIGLLWGVVVGTSCEKSTGDNGPFTHTNTPLPLSTEVFAPTRGANATTTPTLTGGILSTLPLPPGTTINRTGCASDGHCEWFNFYWVPTHEVVLQGSEPYAREVHELCHAYQHWVINRGAPTRNNLIDWYETEEAQDYGKIAQDWPYTSEFTIQPNLLEDFAEACSLWYTDPLLLEQLSPARLDWMRKASTLTKKTRRL